MNLSAVFVRYGGTLSQIMVLEATPYVTILMFEIFVISSFNDYFNVELVLLSKLNTIESPP